MLRYLTIGSIVLLVLAIAAVFVIPPLVEQSMNGVLQERPYQVSSEDSAYFSDLGFIADLHSDALLWGRDLNKRVSRGHVDIPRLIEGNVALQAFTIVSKTPKGQNYSANTDDTDNITALMVVQARHPRTWTSLLERGLDQAGRLAASAKIQSCVPNYHFTSRVVYIPGR